MAEAVAAEVGKSVVSGIASKVTEIFVNPLGREISYVFGYQSYVEKLSRQVENLKSKRQRVEQDVKDAERQGDEVYDDVKQWMNEVVGAVDKLTVDVDKAKNKRCFGGFCPRKLSKEAVKAEQVANDLLAGGNFSKVSYRPSPERTEFGDGVKDYHQFDSRMKVFQDVMEELKKESKFNMIGVYGMGGVGKTTLVKRVVKKVMEDKLFDEVVMAEVTQTPDLETIQDKVAYDLGLKFDQNERVHGRADRLRRRLKKEKTVLVVLDNIWGKLDLEAVGIPSGVDDSRQCRILLTSRDQHVLCNVMNSQQNFKIEVLSDAEAMSLFWNTMADHSTKTSDFQSLAVDIVGKCGGLPLAIKTIANALKNKPLPVWKNALNQLRNSRPRQIPGMDADVYSSIKLSYDFLQSEEAKSLFRLCALQKDGSKILINDLVMHGMGLDLFTDVCTLQEGRIMVHALINNLKTSCLLLDGDTEGDVKMHDIVHAVAVSIARDKLMHNIHFVADLKKEAETGIRKDATAISLPYRDVPELPQRLECPKLKLFLLYAEHGNSLQIPNHFFEGTKQLRVLGLRRIHFSSLSSSLDCLVNLRTLSLINCRSLGDVAIVGELKKLEILCFRGSVIEQLPGQIGQLTQLKLLDLRDCFNLKVIASNVISKLSQLEELYVGESFTHWGKGEGESNASIVELKALSKLTILDIHIRNVQIMAHDWVSVELEGFKILIGDVPWWGYETSRTLKLSGLDKSLYKGNKMKNLLKRAEYLYLDKLNGFHGITELGDSDGFPLLKLLRVKNSSEILYIVNSVGLLCNALPMLESLFLSNLINLKNIWDGQLIGCQCFSKLRFIDVKKCHKLKHLFSFSVARTCVQLQEIQVTDCENLDFIVGKERENHIVCNNESIDFTQLHSLTLRNLPQLTSSGLETSQSLSASTSATKEIIAEDDAEEFIKVLFNNKVFFPKMEKLELTSLDIEKIWLDQFPPTSIFSCQNLTKLTVDDCNCLKFLFSYATVSSLVRLEELVVRRCKSIKRVIDTTGLGKEDEERMIELIAFPKLYCLELFELPKLTELISVSSSKENDILCDDTDMQPLFDGKVFRVVFPKLYHLTLSYLPKFTRVMSMNSSLLEENSTLYGGTGTQLFDRKVRFPNLTTLKVFECNGLRNLATFSATEILLKLTRMEVSYCKKIESIIEMQAGEKVEDLVVFSQLEYLKLNYLLKLENFCSGNYSLEFPCLAQVVVDWCPNMKVFSQGVVRTPVLHQVQWTIFKADAEGRWEGNLNSTIQKLFEEEVGFRSFRSLTLSQFPHLKEIWHDEVLPARLFRRLISLTVDDCAFMLSAIPANWLPFLSNLNFLEVRNCNSVEEVVHLEELNADENNVLLFPNLKTLYLRDLPKLERFCNFNGDIIDDAQSFFDEKVKFPNLTTLGVYSCNALRNLAKFSAAESLVNLRNMKIDNCEKMENIIGLQVGEEVEEDLLVFSQLEYLRLNRLHRLESFCLGNYTLEFPCLAQVLVKECPSMKIFSQGVVRTPMLHGVTSMRNELCWEGNLNSTAHKLFEEMVGFLEESSFRLSSEFLKLEEMCNDLPVRVFDNL
ncbi:Disease resistance protein [Melia azedarach]|uniref:Disease resistance protein n=1 Tax=Melia azedarach TaxID=155640 RepID=A0ACC1YC57_MELAZ|nr:Disease resistance protein [Melia azedarach]